MKIHIFQNPRKSCNFCAQIRIAIGLHVNLRIMHSTKMSIKQVSDMILGKFFLDFVPRQVNWCNEHGKKNRYDGHPAYLFFMINYCALLLSIRYVPFALVLGLPRRACGVSRSFAFVSSLNHESLFAYIAGVIFFFCLSFLARAQRNLETRSRFLTPRSQSCLYEDNDKTYR